MLADMISATRSHNNPSNNSKLILTFKMFFSRDNAFIKAVNFLFPLKGYLEVSTFKNMLVFQIRFQICSILLTATHHHRNIEKNCEQFSLPNLKFATSNMDNSLTCNYLTQFFNLNSHYKVSSNFCGIKRICFIKPFKLNKLKTINSLQDTQNSITPLCFSLYYKYRLSDVRNKQRPLFQSIIKNLDQFKVPSKSDGKVQKFPIHPLPSICIASPIIISSTRVIHCLQ